MSTFSLGRAFGRNRISAIAVTLLVAGLAGPVGAADSAFAGQQAKATPEPAPTPAKPAAATGDDGMRVVLVKGGAPDCKTDCTEWLSAEGTIVGGTADVFEQALQALGDRQVPLFISSPGGDVEASLAIGRMLRERHFTVSVTHTTFTGCAPTDKTCGKEPNFAGYRGTPVSAGTECASSCVMILASGDKRYVARDAKVGVHQVANLQMEDIATYKFSKYDLSDSIMQVERELISERLVPRARYRIGNDASIYTEKLVPYFTEMGISDALVKLMQGTDAARIHWMTAKELTATHLVTNAAAGETLIALAPVASIAAPQRPAAGLAMVTDTQSRRRSE